MSSIKTLPDNCRGGSSLPLRGPASEMMGVLRACFADIGVVLKSRPYSITAKVWASDGQTEVVCKSRVYNDSEGMFLDMTRRGGDGLLFVHVFWEIQEALARFRLDDPCATPFDAQSFDSALYGFWPQEEVSRFEDEHSAIWAKVRAGQIGAKVFQEHVSKVPHMIRRAKLGWACLRKVRACELLDELICEATAYWASVA